MTVTAVVLAGGRSARFGASKLDADLAGRPLLDWTIDAVAAVADEVIVVGRGSVGATVGVPEGAPAAASPRPSTGRTPWFVADAEAYAGPLAGLVTALGTAAGEHVLVVGGDMPLLRQGVLRALLSALDGPSRPGAAVLLEGGRRRPLPLALLRMRATVAASEALDAGERSLRGFLDRLVVDVVPEPAWRELDPHGDTLLDVDVEADLEAVHRRLADSD
jgi:molybdopterin-guanine dinucleotide biosynthesis protein A